MDSILVTLENLDSQAKKVDNKATEYYNHYMALLNEVEDFTSTDWKGEDADAFREKVKDFGRDFTKMKELMEEYASFLRQAATNYRNTQENVRNNIKGLR